MAATVVAIGSLLYYLLTPSGPQPFTATTFPGGIELSWTANPSNYYSLGYSTNPGGPWREFWQGSSVDGETVAGDIILNAFPPTSDSNSLWGVSFTFTNNPMTNRLMSVYITLSNDTRGFFHLWTRSVSPTLSAQLTIKKQ